MNTKKIEMWVSIGAGAMDGATGLGLLLQPGRMLGLMGIEVLPQTALTRLVGAFVLGVGLLYLLGWRVERRRGDGLALLGTWAATAILRACVGTTALALVWSRQLESAWLSVAATDLGLAVFQAIWLSRRDRW